MNVAGADPSVAGGLATDARSLAALSALASKDPRSALRQTARQMESLFMDELVKSMRTTTLSSGELDNAGSNLGTQMLDSQLATQLSGLPGGLSEAIVKQLQRQMGLAPKAGSADAAAPAVPAAAAAAPEAAATAPTSGHASGAAGFVERHSAAAQAAEAATGIPASFMVAQAAQETGWGRKQILNPDGSPSHNLFGVKAGAGWKGPTTNVTTTEYVNGQPQKVVARFRAYASDAESFADYARLMKTSPRYQNVVASAGSAAGFAQGLQRAGYATDPAYADKLTRVINTTLRLQRLVA